ncbi:2OG-Fe(II) oxygenase [Pigmentiphaga sp. GD03639]|nr:2OG-Fe(II) oxygenase [Pigmentiphaga sp. GD03639]MDH2236034.1 2OG-Fe(II) oxygenase [Pigmentiphaga sp. GD03639]
MRCCRACWTRRRHATWLGRQRPRGPPRGSGGPYRIHLKHGISRVHQGERVAMELSFHDAR